MQAYDNVIVTDVDGVILFWEHNFHMWMVSEGYTETQSGFYDVHHKYGIDEHLGNELIEMFNCSEAFKRLAPVRDAIKYVKKLHEDHGFVFHCITAIPSAPQYYRPRRENLENLFGKTAIEELVLCGSSANKRSLLKRYEGTGCLWIEDLVENLEYGVDCGMHGILMDHHYNRSADVNFDYTRVHSWKEIYDIAVG